MRSKTLTLHLDPKLILISHPNPLLNSTLQASKKILGELEKKEREKRDAARAKNDLESYIISTQGTLEEEAFEAVTTPKQRAAFQKQLAAMEDWLYTEGEDEGGPVFR